jgi:aspartate aminotransferase
VTPDGAFYFFVDMRKYLAAMQSDDDHFCDYLLKQKGVVAIPGSYFGQKGVGHIRLTFVTEPEARIDVGMKRMGEYVFSYAFSMAR